MRITYYIGTFFMNNTDHIRKRRIDEMKHDDELCCKHSICRIDKVILKRNMGKIFITRRGSVQSYKENNT